MCYLNNFYNMFSFNEKKKEKKPRKLNIIVASILAVMGIFVAYKLSVASYQFMRDFEVEDLVFMFGGEIKHDTNGYTNFLLLGHGDENHDGPELTDTIIIASFDPQTKSVVMLSIPRDFYVQTEYYGSSRINEVFRNVKNRLIKQKGYTEEDAHTEAIHVLKSKVEEITDLDLQYYAMINFSGFKAIVDALGGIEVEVENDIRDTTYPADTGWGYQVFSIKKGLQTLDGKTALKYARSRHTTSDFDRALRQQKVLQSIRDKALEMKTLTSPSKLRALYDSINANFESDLSMGEIITMAKYASKTPRENVISKVLVDDPTLEGGFLATPPRENYGGAFVLVPYTGDLSEIHRYANLLFKNRGIYLEKAQIEIQNGTKLSGIANKIANTLYRYSFNVTHITNTENKKPYAKTTILLNDSTKYPENSLMIPMLITGEVIDQTATGADLLGINTLSENTTGTGAEASKPNIVIILGDDYQKATSKL